MSKYDEIGEIGIFFRPRSIGHVALAFDEAIKVARRHGGPIVFFWNDRPARVDPDDQFRTVYWRLFPEYVGDEYRFNFPRWTKAPENPPWCDDGPVLPPGRPSSRHDEDCYKSDGAPVDETCHRACRR